MTSERGKRVRRSAGTASTSLMCTVPTTSSRLPRKTGNRDSPVARVALATSSQVAWASRATTWTRGVITFSAVRSARLRVRTNSSAVSGSRAPSLAECRASAASSCGPRAEASSSAGSTPKARTTWLAVLFRWLMNGRKAALNQRCALPTRLATASGEEIAQFLGTSSPTTIRNTVDSAVPSTSATDRDAECEMPSDSRGPAISAAIDGSESMPTTRLVTVMPSCAPESWKVRCRTAFRAPEAPRSPRSTARSSSLRSTVVRENSAATKAPQASESRIATSSRSTSVIGSPPSHDRTGQGGSRHVAYWEAGPWADAHTFREDSEVPIRPPMVKDRQSDQVVWCFTQRRHCSSGAYPAARHACCPVSLRSSTIASPRRPPTPTNRSSAAVRSAEPMARRRYSGCTASR